MTIEVVSLIVLLVMFVVASVLPINLGIMGFVAAFIIGALVGGLTVDDIFGVFPGDLFILLAGVTFLFAIAQNNGTVDLLMNWGVRLVAALVFVAFGGLGLLRRRITPEEATADAEAGNSDDGGLTFYRGATLAGIAILAVAAFAFGSSDRFDIGFAAFVIGLILVLLAPSEQGAALGRMPWPAILLICGILTYVGVLDQIGTIAYMQDLIAGVGSPVVAALAASYVGGIISAFASTAAILGASIPLAEPILQGSGLSAIGVVSSIAISSAIVDISPLSTNGALLIANAQGVDERKFFRQLLAWAVGVVVFAPLLAWLVFVVIGIP